MKVKAIRNGYYGRRRREGDVFELNKGDKPGTWMEKIEEPKRTPTRSKPTQKTSDSADDLV